MRFVQVIVVFWVGLSAFILAIDSQKTTVYSYAEPAPEGDRRTNSAFVPNTSTYAEDDSSAVVIQKSRGYLTTPAELTRIMQKAEQGKEPYKSSVAAVLQWANKPWDYSLDTEVSCPNADEPAWIDDQNGTPKLYARALAYHLTEKESYAAEVKTILERIMTEVVSISLEEQQCRLNFSWGTPELVASADLIEGYWNERICTGPANTAYGSSALTSGPCKRLFQNWLAKNPYYLVSYSAERAQSNWGAAATNTTSYIADYLWDRKDIRLITRTEKGNTRKGEISLTPAQAYSRSRKNALDRMNGFRVELDSNKSCDFLAGSQQKKNIQPVKSQITELGIIPEDARRDEFCNVPIYDGTYQNYPQLHLGNNIQQCELMLRRGDSSCYQNVNTKTVVGFQYTDSKGKVHKTTLKEGRGSIERAIKAIIVDSKTEWRKDSSLAVAYRYYYNHHTLSGFDQWARHLDRPNICAQDICFGTLTHGFAPGETPQPPPTVKPPA
jgi:hypothetical protein